MGSLDNVVFGKKKFSDILSEIYDNQKRKEKQISGLIAELKPLISDIGDATLIVPLIKEYLDVQVKNNDHLVRMASVVQRAMTNSASAGSNDLLISEEEKEQLLLEVKKMGDETKQIEDIQTKQLQLDK